MLLNQTLHWKLKNNLWRLGEFYDLMLPNGKAVLRGNRILIIGIAPYTNFTTASKSILILNNQKWEWGDINVKLRPETGTKMKLFRSVEFSKQLEGFLPYDWSELWTAGMVKKSRTWDDMGERREAIKKQNSFNTESTLIRKSIKTTLHSDI